MKKIILPTDFSDNALNATRFALNLFKDETCTFYLMNTYTPAIYQTEYVLHSPGQIGLGDIYQTESMDQLEELQKQLEREFHNEKHTIMTHSAFNILVDEIADMVEKEEADMIIMGTQGASGAKEIFLGTHTVHVIKKASCPVLAIPSGYSYKDPDAILFPTDFEVDYQADSLEVLLYLSETFNSRLDVLHMASGYGLTEQQQAHKEQLQKIFSGRDFRYHEVSDMAVIEGINKHQKDHKVNFLAMIQNKHTFLERLFIEPVIKKIGFHVSIPFLVIPHS